MRHQSRGVAFRTFARYGEDRESYNAHTKWSPPRDPQIVLDGGADLIAFIAEHAHSL